MIVTFDENETIRCPICGCTRIKIGEVSVNLHGDPMEISLKAACEAGHNFTILNNS